MERKIDELYEYCKSKGYNESREKFEEDLSQLIVEELENEELLNVSGGRKGINAITAGLISALSVASPIVSAQQAHFDGNKVMTPVSDTTKVNQSSKKKTIDSMKSKINLKNILLGVGGVSILGNAVLVEELIRSKCKKIPIGNIEKIICVLFEIGKNSREQLERCYDKLDEIDKCAFFGESYNEDYFSLLEKTFMKSTEKQPAIDLDAFIENYLLNALSKDDDAKKVAENLKAEMKKQGKVLYTVGEEAYIPINTIDSVSEDLLNQSLLGSCEKNVKAESKRFKDKFNGDKASMKSDIFYNCSTYDNKTFKMFLDVCAELLKGCPNNLFINFDETVTREYVNNVRLRCFDVIVEAMKKDENVSATSIVSNLKDEEFLTDLKGKIKLNNDDDDKAKWNAVGIVLLIVYGDNYTNTSYVNSKASVDVSIPILSHYLTFSNLSSGYRPTQEAPAEHPSQAEHTPAEPNATQNSSEEDDRNSEPSVNQSADDYSGDEEQPE